MRILLIIAFIFVAGTALASDDPVCAGPRGGLYKYVNGKKRYIKKDTYNGPTMEYMDCEMFYMDKYQNVQQNVQHGHVDE